jgi:hypothetical protein
MFRCGEALIEDEDRRVGLIEVFVRNKAEFVLVGESSPPRFSTIIVVEVSGRRIGWTTAEQLTSLHSGIANGRGFDT